MALFAKKTPMQILQADLDGLKARAALLSAERSTCAATLDAAVAARQAHLLDGDIADRKVSEALHPRVDIVQSALVGLDAAIVELQARINTAEQALTAETRRIKCEADAKALGAVVASLENKFGPWLDSTRAIAADLESLNGHTYQPAPLAAFFRHMAGEAEFALRMTLDDLARSIPAVIAGIKTVRIGIEPVVAAKAVIAAPTKDHFTYTEQKHGPTFQVPNAFTKESN
jgi:hypothetical protein